MKRVLIVDDDPLTLDFLEIVLRDAGYAPIRASNPVEAYRQVEKERPDLIITDVRMPVLDGIELCAVIRAQHDVPMIIVTGSENVPQNGPVWDCHILKPIDVPVLLENVRRLLEGADIERPGPKNRWLYGGAAAD